MVDGIIRLPSTLPMVYTLSANGPLNMKTNGSAMILDIGKYSSIFEN